MSSKRLTVSKKWSISSGLVKKSSAPACKALTACCTEPKAVIISTAGGKFELAKQAKELNLDATHDTVHEMARDEARHGKAFEGLLKRYFG